MKLPFGKDENCNSKRMMSADEARSRREFHRETSLLSSNGISHSPRCALMIDKAVQYDSTNNNMEYNAENTADFNGSSSISSYTPPPSEEKYTSEGLQLNSWSETLPITARSSSPLNAAKRSHQQARTEPAIPLPYPSSSSSPPSTSTNAQSAMVNGQTEAIVEDNTARCKLNNNANQTYSSPGLSPSDVDGHQMQTWRMSDRRHTESSDEIEKVEDSFADGGDYFPDKDTKRSLHLGSATTASPNSSSTDAAANASQKPQHQNHPEGEDDDGPGECVVQCLSYTLQCCECSIS